MSKSTNLLEKWNKMLSKPGASQLNVPKSEETLSIAQEGQELGYWNLLPEDSSDKSYVLQRIGPDNPEKTMSSKKKTKTTGVEETVKPATKKSSPKPAKAPKPAKEPKPAKSPKAPKPAKEPKEAKESKGRKATYPNDMTFTLGAFKMPSSEEAQQEKLGARSGTSRFFIRMEMCALKKGTIGEIREHLRDNQLAFNNFDFQYLIDAGIISVA